MYIIIINVKNKVYKNGYSCTSKTAKIHRFFQICNLLFYHYSASSILLRT